MRCSEKPRLNKLGFCLLTMLSLFLASLASHAQGRLDITPTYVHLDNRNRGAEILVINRKNQPMTVRLSHRFMRATSTGLDNKVTSLQAEERPADDLIRYAPRQVTIAPGTSQSIRMVARKPADLPTGEYRTHLIVREVPTAFSPVDDELQEGELSVKLRAIHSISIPVIVKNGDLQTRASLSDLKLERKTEGEQQQSATYLSFAINSHGNATPRGDLIAEYLPRGGGNPIQVGLSRAASVLYPLKSRIKLMRLNAPAPLQLSGGTLRLRYVDILGYQAKPQELARAELALP